MHSKVLTTVFAAALTTALGAGAALAADKCSAPQAEWQPQQVLQQKLEAEGWKVKKIKVEDGCYEVYGVDAKGNRLESYYDPKSFTVVKAKSEG